MKTPPVRVRLLLPGRSRSKQPSRMARMVRRNIKTRHPSASGMRGTDMTLGNQSRSGAPVLWITIHTSQGFLGSPNDLYHYFDTVRTGSSHVCADDNGIYEWIPYDRAAWTLRNGNNYS